MEEKEILVKISEEQKERLLAEARKAKEKAYTPYSNYKVGAALLTRSGQIFGGCNIENASYGATICAERVAAVKALSAGEKDFLALAVLSDSEEPGTPCGICRQFLVEFAPQLPLIMGNLQGKVIVGRLDHYLPSAFNKEYLK